MIEGREWHGKSISIHSLRVEGDEGSLHNNDYTDQFQSTPSVWRETPAVQYDAPRESISIHSLRVEGDRRACPG